MAKIVGLDLGIASVGWAIIDTEQGKILGRGVRTFSACEDPKEKTSLAVPRRMARGTRRRLARAASRMKALKEMFVQEGFFSQEVLDELYVLGPGDKTPYELRFEGLDRKLTEEEWARMLTQLCKRRGYKSMRLGEDNDDDAGKVKQALGENKALMQEKGYRTAGEMLYKDEKFADNKRNKGGYANVLPRELLLQEVEMLFARQAELGNPHATGPINERYLVILQTQKQIKEGEALTALVGPCTFYANEKRAPMACFTFEKFRFLQKLTNVRWADENGEFCGLDPEQMAEISEKSLSLKGAINYKHIRDIVGVPQGSRFTTVRVKSDDWKEYLKEEKDTKLPPFKAYNDIKDAVEAADEAEWAVIAHDESLLDEIASILTYYKYAESVTRELNQLGKLSSAAIAELAKIPAYSKNGHLSLKALREINVYLAQGMRYVDATRAAGYSHSQRVVGNKKDKLPPVPNESIVNPVVVRTLSQARKVINAIIREYGAFDEVHIELARDMNKSKEERSRIEREQKERKKQADSRLEEMKDDLELAKPRPHDIVKYRLWKEQNGQCAYSGNYIDPKRITEPGYVEDDHILPYSRSFNNSLDNRVLVLTVENQRKGPHTPWEYKRSNPAEWHRFEEWVGASTLSRRKKENLVTQTFDEREEEFRSRNLNDTRYASRFLKNFIEDNLEFEEGKKVRVVPVNGSVTAYLRNAWQLSKSRSEDGDRHHALDALVIAATSSSIVQKIGTFFGARFLRNIPKEVRAQYDYYDAQTGELIDRKYVPEPWEHFSNHVRIWMAEDPRLDETLSSDPMPLEERCAIKPLFVSKAPKRKATGQAHKETLKRIVGIEQKTEIDKDGNIIERKSTGRILTAKKVALSSLKINKDGKTNFEGMLEKDTSDKTLYEALVARLKEFGGDGAKAFKEPFYKPSKTGKKAPIVRSITVQDDPSSGGVEIRNGFSGNGSMIRVDVFKSKPDKKGKVKYYLVPIYVADTVKKELPNKAIVGGRAESDWLEMDEGYEFNYSLYPNDLVLLRNKGQEILAYYVKTGRSTASITVRAHDSKWEKGSLGVMNLDAFEKYEVNILGNSISEVKKEKRLGFSNRHNK